MSEAIRKSSEYLNTDYLNDIHSKLIGYFLENEKNPLIASEKVISLKSDIEVFLLKLTNIKDVKLSKNILEVTDGKQVYLFDLENVQNPFLGKKESVEKIKKNYSEELSKARDIISLMDIIFSKNSKEWFKELNEKDSLSQNDIDDYISYGYKVETLKKYDSKEVDLRLLQKEFLLIYSDLQKINPESLTKKQQENLLSLEESYLERALGVGNRFEGAGSYLPNDENTIFSFIDGIIKKKNVSESINYFDWISRQIFENKHKATPVMNTYVILFKKAKERIFEKMKIDGASEKDYLRFVQILRGTGIYDIDSEMRGIGVQWMDKIFSKDVAKNISDSEVSLTDHDFVQEVLLHGMSQKGGVIDKVKAKGSFGLEDNLIKDKSPKQLMETFVEKIKKKKGFYNIISDNALGLGTILSTQETQYNNLSYREKVNLSILHRFSQKVNTIESANHINEELINLSEKFYRESANKLEKFIEGGWNPLSSEFYNGKTGSIFGLTDVQEKLFEEFKGVHGIGILEGGDLTDSYRNGVVAIGATIGSAILAPQVFIPTAGIATKTAVGGGMASVTTLLQGGKGYNTIEEAAWDIPTDIGLGIVSGGISGKIFNDIKNPVSIFLKKHIPRDSIRTAAIIIADMGLLGLGLETIRSVNFENTFYSDPIFTEETEKQKN